MTSFGNCAITSNLSMVIPLISELQWRDLAEFEETSEYECFSPIKSVLFGRAGRV